MWFVIYRKSDGGEVSQGSSTGGLADLDRLGLAAKQYPDLRTTPAGKKWDPATLDFIDIPARVDSTEEARRKVLKGKAEAGTLTPTEIQEALAMGLSVHEF